jgi:S1-C subfamily serine protease
MSWKRILYSLFVVFIAVTAALAGPAIPNNTAQAAATQIIQNGFIAHPYLGINYQPITPDIASAYRVPAQWGVYFTGVASGSPVSKGGLQQGDHHQHQWNQLDETHQYLNVLLTNQPGEQVKLQSTA